MQHWLTTQILISACVRILTAYSYFGRKQILESFLFCIYYKHLFWTPCDRSAISPLLLSKVFIISALKIAFLWQISPG